jgi:hypothetical protein
VATSFYCAHLQINSALNALELGSTCLTSLSSLSLLSTSAKDYRTVVMRAFNALPSLERLEVCWVLQPDQQMSWPSGSKDSAGRSIMLDAMTGDRLSCWVLSRDLALDICQKEE